MVKKVIKWVVIIFLIFIALCVIVALIPTDDDTSQKKTEPKNKVFWEKIQTEDSRSGSGDVIGKYAYIEMDKADFQKKSYKTIKKEFKRIEKLSDKYDYFNIYFDDDTGILLPGCAMDAAMYGDKVLSKYEDGYTIEDFNGITCYIADKDKYFVLVDENDSPLSDKKKETGINGIEE